MRITTQAPEIAGSALQAGRIDAHAAFVPFADLFPWRGFAREILDGSQTNAPTMHGTLVDAAYAEKYPEIVVAYLRAAIKADRLVSAEPEAYSELIAKVTGVEPLRRDPRGHGPSLRTRSTRAAARTGGAPDLDCADMAAAASLYRRESRWGFYHLRVDHREALGVIGYLEAESAIPALASSAKDSDAEVRRATMAALVFIRAEAPGVATLIEGLPDAAWQVREAAAVSAGKVQLRAALKPLIGLMQDEAWQVRVKAASALGRLRDALDVDALGTNLSSEISNVRKEAAAALGEIGDVGARKWLAAASDDPDPEVRKIVRWAYERCRS